MEWCQKVLMKQELFCSRRQSYLRIFHQPVMPHCSTSRGAIFKHQYGYKLTRHSPFCRQLNLWGGNWLMEKCLPFSWLSHQSLSFVSNLSPASVKGSVWAQDASVGSLPSFVLVPVVAALIVWTLNHNYLNNWLNKSCSDKQIHLKLI